MRRVVEANRMKPRDTAKHNSSRSQTPAGEWVYRIQANSLGWRDHLAKYHFQEVLPHRLELPEWLHTTSVFCLLKVYIFLFSSPEMRPQWFDSHQIPFSQMWPDDILWFPLLLQKKKFLGYFKFQGHDVILSHTLEEVEKLWERNCIYSTQELLSKTKEKTQPSHSSFKCLVFIFYAVQCFFFFLS